PGRVIHGRGPRRLRDADPRRPTGRCDAIHPPGRGRPAMAVRRSDHPSMGGAAGRSADLRSWHLGPRPGGPAHRTRRTRVAQGLAIDTTFWGARVLGAAAVERELTRLRRALIAHAREQGLVTARAS